MEFKKYTFREFLNLEAEEMQSYETTGLLLKSKSWGVSDFMKWPYATVKEIQLTLSGTVDYEAIIEIIIQLTGMSRDKILSKCWIDIFGFIKFVVESIDKVNEHEKKLAYEPDQEEIQAGIEMYNQFGHYSTIDRLAGGDPLKYESIGEMEYAVIFVKLMLNKTDTQYAKNYQRAIK